MVRETSLCGLGQSAPNPVLSTIRFFQEEYTRLLKPPTEFADGGTGGAHASVSAEGKE